MRAHFTEPILCAHLNQLCFEFKVVLAFSFSHLNLESVINLE